MGNLFAEVGIEIEHENVNIGKQSIIRSEGG